MEYWDLYTADRIKTGETHLRGTTLPKNRYHLVVNVWLKNSEGKYLISKRSRTKLRNPLKFETVAGAVLKGENSIQAAVRETKEEVGIDLIPEEGKLIYSDVRRKINGNMVNSILDAYLFYYDAPVDLNNATTDEVESVSWMTVDEIRKLSEERLLVRAMNYCFTKVFTQ